jgi:signal transduction histidine kinase
MATGGSARLSLEFTIVALQEPDGRIEGVAALMRDVTARFEETRELRRQLAALAGGGAGSQG